MNSSNTFINNNFFLIEIFKVALHIPGSYENHSSTILLLNLISYCNKSGTELIDNKGRSFGWAMNKIVIGIFFAPFITNSRVIANRQKVLSIFKDGKCR
jgi:hypothetical protein